MMRGMKTSRCNTPRRVRTWLAALVVAGLGGPAAAVAGATELPALMKQVALRGELSAYQYRLDNGLTVVLTPNPAAPLVSIYHWVKAGSLHETPGVTGIAHLFEHMMFRPVGPGRPDFWAHVARLGGDANASTRFESTVYTTNVPPARLAEAFKLEAERFRKVRVTDRLLDIERKAVWSEYSTKMDSNPTVDLWDAIYRVGFPGHPYGWMIIGAREDLAKIKAADCSRFFTRTYLPNNTGLFVSGNFPREAALRWIVDAYGAWKPGEASAPPPALPGPGQARPGGGQAAGRLARGAGGLPAPAPDGRNHRLFALANHVLFASDYSLARRRLRDDRKLVSDITAFNFEYDNGMLKALAVLLPDAQVAAVIDQLGRLVEDFAALKPDEYQAYLREYQLRKAEAILRNEVLNEALALHWGKYGDVQFLPDVTRAPLAVGKDDLLRFLKTFVGKDNQVAVVHKGGGK